MCRWLLLCLTLAIGTLGFAADDVEDVKAYLLPEEHPLKRKLDSIFKKSHVLKSEKTLSEAGFSFTKGEHSQNVYVASHPNLKKHLLKLYTEKQSDVSEMYHLVKRIQGANLIREFVAQHGLEDLFIVPKKWLYHVPEKKRGSKQFILVVEKIPICAWQLNEAMWKSKAVPRNHLIKLHFVVQNLGLIDSIYPTNIPFTREGKIAFIDTEHFHHWPVDFAKLGHHLSRENQAFLLSIR